MEWINSFIQKLKPSDRDPLAATIDSAGVCQTSSGLVIKWGDLALVFAYKKDCTLMDDIRLVFSDGKNQIECSESAQSFSELSVALSARLVLDVPDWYERLMASPAFEATPTVVYTRHVSPGLATVPTRSALRAEDSRGRA